jgi:8-oxo-dGTP diphosphatase
VTEPAAPDHERLTAEIRFDHGSIQQESPTSPGVKSTGPGCLGKCSVKKSLGGYPTGCRGSLRPHPSGATATVARVHRFSSIVLVDRRGWLLLQERDEHPVIDPEKWCFPGGMVEPGESFEQAAYRELEEETGVRLDGELTLFEQFTVFHTSCGEHDEFQLFATRTELTDADIECHEGRRIVFVEPGAARGLDLAQAAAVALPAFLASGLYASMAP